MLGFKITSHVLIRRGPSLIELQQQILITPGYESTVEVPSVIDQTLKER